MVKCRYKEFWGEIMEKKIKNFLTGYRSQKKKRFTVEELEAYLVEQAKGARAYLDLGGYEEFYRLMIRFREEGIIREIRSSPYNGLKPALRLRWELLDQGKKKWDRGKLLKYSDLLDFSYYIKNPKYQTDKEWAYIENIYNFLKEREGREWASVEERSLELFYDEKFLVKRKDRDKGRYGILSRLKLDYDDLKMKNYGEMFIYWNRGVKDPRNIIILENHSTFFSYKRFAEKNLAIFGFRPDILIYGEGKKIENSFSFIQELADIKNIRVLYFGDMDLEGLGIFYRLKERYGGIDIGLQKQAYLQLLRLCQRDYSNSLSYNPYRENFLRPLYLELFLGDMARYLMEKDFTKLIDLYDRDLRIPQELITYEYLARVMV